MADPEYLGRIRAYLEQHRQTYDQAALRQKLLSDGHPESVVDLALAQVYGYDSPPPSPAVERSSGLSIALTVLLTFIGTYVLLGLLIGISANDSSGLSLFLLLAVLPAQIIAALLVRRRNRPLARGLAWGIAAAWLPIVSIVLLIGICLSVYGFS